MDCVGGAGGSARTEAEADLHATATFTQPRTEAEAEADLHATATCWWPVAGGRPSRCAAKAGLCCGWSLESGGLD